MISLSAVIALIFLELVGVQYQTLQLKQVSDVLALKVASDLRRDGIEPLRNLEYLPVVSELLGVTSAVLGVTPSQVSVLSKDGKTITASVCADWRSITGFKLGVFGEVCSSSKARAIA